VHEPLMRQGVPGLQMAEEMENLAGDLLPFSSPLMDYLHQRFLREFLERDVIGHMENDLDESIDLGRVRVTIAFADLAGWPRIGVHQGVTLYRDGDYYGRDVNLAARVVARSRGGEVLVSGAVAESLGGERDLRFDNIGQVKLKGFDDPVQLCRPVVEE